MTAEEKGVRMLSVRLPADLVLAVKLQAVKEGKTVTEVVEGTLSAWLRSKSNG